MDLPKDAVLVDTRPRPAYEAGHLPGARHLDLSAPRLRLREEAELKALEAGLTELFQSLGLKSPVVLYDEGLTSRLCRTAFFLGLGGLEVTLWTEAGKPTPRRRKSPSPSARGWWPGSGGTGSSPPMRPPATPFFWTCGAPRSSRQSPPPLLPPGRAHPREQERPAGSVPGNPRLLERLSLEPGQEVGVYCHSGARSAVAFFVLRSLGVKARNYLGSMHEWLQEGLPTEP